MFGADDDLRGVRVPEWMRGDSYGGNFGDRKQPHGGTRCSSLVLTRDDLEFVQTSFRVTPTRSDGGRAHASAAVSTLSKVPVPSMFRHRTLLTWIPPISGCGNVLYRGGE